MEVDDCSAVAWTCSPAPCSCLVHWQGVCTAPCLPRTFRVLVVLSDILTAFTAHALGADVVASVLCATKSWPEGVICFLYPDLALGIDGSKEVANVIVDFSVPSLDGSNRGWPAEGAT